MNKALTRSYVYTQTRQSLGEGIVDVEVTDDQIDGAVRSAIDLYNRHRPRSGTLPATLAGSDGRYVVDAHNVQGVYDVSFMETGLGGTTGIAYDVFNPPFIRGGYANGLSAEGFALLANTMEDARRNLGTTPDWQTTTEVDGDGEAQLVLYVNAPVGQFNVSYSYYWTLDYEYVPIVGDPDGYGAFGMKHVDAEDVGWIMSYVQAKAKQALGRTYRKFGGISDEQGGIQPLDGDALVAEAAQDIERLEDEMESRRKRTVPQTF